MKHIILPVVAMILSVSLYGQAVKESDLTPQEKAIYNPVNNKANNDPNARKAKDAVRVIRIEKITKLDPALKTVADKVLPPPAVNPNDLPADEKTKWNNALKAISNDPDVKKAVSDLQQARIDAMLKLNPAVKPILQKLYPENFGAPAPTAAPGAAPAAPADAADAAQ